MTSERQPTLTLVFVLLVAASMVCSFWIPLAGRRLRPEHLTAPIAFIALLVVERRRLRSMRVDVFAVLAAVWVAVNALSSWLFAPQFGESAVHVLRLGLLALTFFTVANLRPFRAEAWAGRLRIWLVLAVIELAYGVLSWIVARSADVWWPGVWFEPQIGTLSVSGTQFERNLYGILAGTVLTVVTYLGLAQRAGASAAIVSTRLLVAAGAVSSVAVALALTRSAWIAVIVAAPLAWLLFDRRLPLRSDPALWRAAWSLPAVLIVFIGLFHLVPTPSPPDSAASRLAMERRSSAVRARVATFGQLESDFTLNTRIQDALWAIEDWRASPWIGRGTGSFLQIHGIRVGTEAWISNVILHTLVDTGLVGLTVQMSLFGLVAYRTWGAATNTTSPGLAAGLRGLTLGFLVMAVAYQLTDGTWLAVFWVHLGLMVNGIYTVAADREASAARTYS